MSSKYSGLPDIASDTAADIFETVDEPDTLLKPSENNTGDADAPVKPQSEAINAKGLPSRRQAERVFARGARRPENATVSFRPRLPPLSRYGSSSSSDSDEPSPLPRETPAARLRRLKAELAEVEAQLGSSSQTQSHPVPQPQAEGKRKSVLPHRQPVDVVSELANVRERLETMEMRDLPAGEVESRGGEWSERLSKLTAAEKRKEVSVGQSTAGEKDVKLSDVDKRLAALEQAVGPIGDGIDQTNTPLLPSINKHDHLLTLLTQPRHLDAISRRVKLLLVDLDRAATASRRGPGGSAITQPGGGEKATGTDLALTQAEYNQLQSLFGVLPRLDPLLPILTPLLARLRSLSALHSEASDIASALKKLQTRDRKSVEEVKELEVVVESVQKGLGEAVEGIRRNWEGLEGRMKSLEERLQRVERQ
ncbi:dynactin 2 [Cryptococcus wingfieldii CBS 7118]|uniref:Dynactin 2 n=1 Tax=Cryptococcus wingfieldii CBS 7118 TaxID=1295528 RepID=A0A1E3K3X9_9TREE|nr:dynactin 2 [Cryptococcus wingfieldii CBS 7118]ODO07576.1 dynactin 2 [Cryptococcus wingfieldii CBS 7118]